MIDVERPAVTRVTAGRARVAVLLSLYLTYGVWSLYVWPIVVLANHAAPWPIPAAYLAAVTGLIVTCVYRTARVALLVSDSGLVVRNFFRSRRLGWREVGRLTDGCVWGDCWALAILQADGRAVISSAASTTGLADPGLLSVLRGHAARHGVPVDLSGIPAWRRRAWEDGPASARWYQVRLAILVPVTAVTLTGLVIVAVWNSGHRNFGPVFLPAGWAALEAVAFTARVWSRRRKARQPDPARRAGCGEGDWFAVPLEPDVYAAGVIARSQRRGRGVMAGYFFAPFDSLPAPEALAELRPGDAALVRQFAKVPIQAGQPAKPGSWTLLGKVGGWDRAAWPVPVYKRRDPKTKQSFKLFCDDELGFIREEPVPRGQARGLPPWALLNEQQVKAHLIRWLDE